MILFCIEDRVIKCVGIEAKSILMMEGVLEDIDAIVVCSPEMCKDVQYVQGIAFRYARENGSEFMRDLTFHGTLDLWGLKTSFNI